MNELDLGAKQLLASMQAGADMPKERHHAIWRDIAQSVEYDAPLRIGEDPTIRPGRRRHSLWLAALGGAVAAAGLIAVVMSQVGSWRSEPQNTADDPYAAERVEQRDEAAGVATVRQPRLAEVDGPPEAPTEALEPAAPEPESSSDDEQADQSDDQSEPSIDSRRNKRRPAKVDPRDEMTLLLEARQAVNARRYASALASLRRHERAFPRSSFVHERRLLRVKALCGAGKIDKARTIVDRHPDSNLGDACPALR
ncbi:MAG: hypothetical protein AAGF11_49455 [Myxococcota bacterium]